jgi:hypothetical protein
MSSGVVNCRVPAVSREPGRRVDPSQTDGVCSSGGVLLISSETRERILHVYPLQIPGVTCLWYGIHHTPLRFKIARHA